VLDGFLFAYFSATLEKSPANLTRQNVMSPEDFRRHASACEEMASATSQPETAAHYRRLAAEYRTKADALEAGSGPPIVGDKTQAPGIELPAPIPEEPKD